MTLEWAVASSSGGRTSSGATADGNRLSGRVFEDGGYWMIEFPSIDVMTQARTRDEICHMAADLLETIVNIPTYAAQCDVARRRPPRKSRQTTDPNPAASAASRLSW